MNYYKITLSYKGTSYSGWQIQENSQKTIQRTLNRALEEISKSNDIYSLASGRTDAGVHAFGQVVKIGIGLDLEAEAIMKGLNSLTPDDITIREVTKIDEKFHPIADSIWKEYIYLFSFGKNKANPIWRDFVTHFPYNLSLENMRTAALLFKGEHDFVNYFTTGSDVQTTVRTIYDCQISEYGELGLFSEVQDPIYALHVRGNGFLKQMVRLIMGTLVSRGQGKITEQDIESSFMRPLERKLGAVAPAEGLVLNKVHY